MLWGVGKRQRIAFAWGTWCASCHHGRAAHPLPPPLRGRALFGHLGPPCCLSVWSAWGLGLIPHLGDAGRVFALHQELENAVQKRFIACFSIQRKNRRIVVFVPNAPDRRRHLVPTCLVHRRHLHRRKTRHVNARGPIFDRNHAIGRGVVKTNLQRVRVRH